MQLRRVVVTGLGALTPLGNSVSEFWNGLVNGVSGAGPITKFDASKFKTRFACEIKGFNPEDFFERKEARKLRPPHSLAYATESMRLTTRLMQLASWLLIRRAVSEGELTPEQAIEEQRKIKLPATVSDQPARDLGALPPRLRELIEQSIKLQARVIRLDHMLGYKQLPPSGEVEHPLKTQLSRLRAAFGTEAD